MSDNSNIPQPFDVVLGGNNPPKKKIEKPELKKIIDTKVTSNSSSKKINLSSKQSTSSGNVEKPEDYTSASESTSTTSNSELEDTSSGCLVIFKWLFYGWITYAWFTDSDSGVNYSFYESISSLSSLAWILGLFSPSFVIRFGLPRNRWTITAIYLPICIIAGLLASSNP